MAWGNQPARALTDGVEAARLLQLELASTSDLSRAYRALGRAIKGRIAFSTSLGIEDQAILHAIAASGAADRRVHARYRPAISRRRSIRLPKASFAMACRSACSRPMRARSRRLSRAMACSASAARIEARKACCHVRKVVPLKRGARRRVGLGHGAQARAIGGPRGCAVRGVGRGAQAHQAQPDRRLAARTARSLRRSSTAIPVNPLHAKGFPSIGCQPCTRAIRPGEDIRAGRWWWENEEGKECGLHNRPRVEKAAQ